jgi:hypothetical protein
MDPNKVDELLMAAGEIIYNFRRIVSLIMEDYLRQIKQKRDKDKDPSGIGALF